MKGNELQKIHKTLERIADGIDNLVVIALAAELRAEPGNEPVNMARIQALYDVAEDMALELKRSNSNN